MHYPMYNKQMETITTSITNLDLHDISRCAKTYNVDSFFIVHPSPNQQSLIKDIMSYWQEGYGGVYNPDRKEAFNIMRLTHDFKETVDKIENETGQKVTTVATDARIYKNSVSYKSLKNKIFNEDKCFLILFGTGWGIAEELINKCDYILHPIEPGGTYNHLSVRSAVSIILDRLLGEFWFSI
ncbi:RNA methyltransferase [Candidatus Syntrophocurvum alkaliphilum]|nr:RNA methyltransferase [Candidatus Syntrophocurvum alkaliphilum]